jgi:hypothetical protein
VKMVRETIEKAIADDATAVDKAIDEFDKALAKHVGNLETDLQETFRGIDIEFIHGAPDGLADRAGRALRAMDRIGTDEDAVFDALRGLTNKSGKALEQYWDDTRHGGSLREWLDSELSGSEYRAAIAHLEGRRLEAAKEEIASNTGWFGTKGQIEKALRGLSPEEIRQLSLDPQFDALKEKIAGKLSGTDLDVANALLAGKPARADALRLKQQIDEARESGDDDKLHDALASIDPKRLPELQVEFAKLLAPEDPTRPAADPKQEDAAKAFADYVTRPVDVYVPGSGEGDPGYTTTLTLSDSSKTLATALVTKGRDSPEARAARLAFEAERGGKPRIEKLQAALEDPELRAAREAVAKDQALPADKQDPRRIERDKQKLDELEQRRNRMMQEFARLRHADPKTQADAKLATDFTEKAVRDVWDDQAGRDLGASMVRDARARPALALKYAVRGWGTREKEVMSTLRGLRSDEIAGVVKDYSDLFDPENPDKLYEDLGVFQNEGTAKAAGLKHAVGGDFFTELSGDDRQEAERLLLGQPMNDRDRYLQAKVDYQHQGVEGRSWATAALTNDWATPPGVYDPWRALNANHDRLDQIVKQAGGPEKAFDEKGNLKDPALREQFDEFTAGTSEAAENYKHRIDSLTDMLTGAIALIGAIVATVVIEAVTFGGATPLVVAAWGAGIAALTGAAAMAASYAMKGSRYGWEEAATDAAITLADAATAGLTAGAGAEARAAMKEVQALEKMAQTAAQKTFAKELIKREARRELVNGFIRAGAGAAFGGMVRTGVADGTWDQGILHGIGHTLGGGVRAGTVGLVTHGVTTGASSLLGGGGNAAGRLAQAEGELADRASSGRLVNKLGAGASSMLGGMAGRASDLAIGAATGEPIGPWDDVLGSIATAGGRDFAQGFAHASVTHALESKAPHGEEPPARARVGRRDSAADELADLQFRRKAVELAAGEDTSFDRRTFLAKLDEAVARDRALQDAQHDLARGMRREMLAGIPPAQRAALEDVPIHVLGDAEFTEFTGSSKARAVTIFVDGEPTILVRAGATDALREEGIHVLQSRDPEFRARIGRLDERTLSRWNELDVETQLSLYRDKVEVEIDAQQRVRRSLLDEAERTVDPQARRALFDRAEATGRAEAALRARRSEVDELTPSQRRAMARGEQEKPQYLREPARLFEKRDLTAAELHPEEGLARETPIEHGSPEVETLPRRQVKLENTTFENDYPGKRVFQVGKYWQELHEGQPRWYRMVEVVDERGMVIDRRREILQVGETPRWQQRGSEATALGARFEALVREKNLEEARRASRTGRIDPATDEVVPIGALKDPRGRPVSAQYGGGAGFDDVILRFRPNSDEVEVIPLVEAKAYRRNLTLEDFSAITVNLEENVARLKQAIAGSDLPEARKQNVLDALDQMKVRFDVETSETGRIGKLGSKGASILQSIQEVATATRELSLAQARLTVELGAEVTRARGRQIAAESDRILALRSALRAALDAEPFDPGGIRRAAQAIAGDPALGRLARPEERIPITLREGEVDTEAIPKGRERDPAFRPTKAVMPSELGRRPIGYGVALANQLELARPASPVRAVAGSAEVVIVEQRARNVAVVRPEAIGGAGAQRATAVLLRRVLTSRLDLDTGVARGRSVRAAATLWDATGQDPADVARVVRQLQRTIEPPDALSNLQIAVGAGQVSDERALRKLGFPPGARLTPQAGMPGNVTSVITFEPPPRPRR